MRKRYVIQMLYNENLTLLLCNDGSIWTEYYTGKQDKSGHNILEWKPYLTEIPQGDI